MHRIYEDTDSDLFFLAYIFINYSFFFLVHCRNCVKLHSTILLVLHTFASKAAFTSAVCLLSCACALLTQVCMLFM